MKLNKIEPKFIKKNNPRIGLITLASDFLIPSLTLLEWLIMVCKVTCLVDLKLYKTDPRESPTSTKSQCLSRIEATFFEYAVRQIILDLFFFLRIFFIFLFIYSNSIVLGGFEVIS